MLSTPTRYLFLPQEQGVRNIPKHNEKMKCYAPLRNTELYLIITFGNVFFRSGHKGYKYK